MKRVILYSMVIFWVSIAIMLIFGIALQNASQAVGTNSSSSKLEKIFSPNEIAKHNSEKSCWLIIRNGVYDVTDYIEHHPTSPKVILKYCGLESTRAFDTKDRGRPHSGYAIELLEKYRIGKVGSA